MEAEKQNTVGNNGRTKGRDGEYTTGFSSVAPQILMAVSQGGVGVTEEGGLDANILKVQYRQDLVTLLK